MALHRMNMPICLVLFTIMTFGASVAYNLFPDSLYYDLDIVGACQYGPTVALSSSRAALVYSMMGSTYSFSASCRYTFTADFGTRIFVNAEKMGLENTRSCLNFYESSTSSFFISNKLATYCGNEVFVLNTTRPNMKLKIELLSSGSTKEAVFRLGVSSFFERGTAASSGRFTCNDGNQVYNAMRWDGHQNCPDNSDETDAPPLSCPFSCGESGPCIAKEWKCDKISDCPNATEEKECVYKCPGSSSEGEMSYKFECSDRDGCFYKSDRCRGKSYSTCNDGTENKNCDDCNGNDDYVIDYDYGRREKFDRYCPMTRTCLTEEQFCNGITDCPNGGDEDDTLCHPSIYWYWTGGQLAGVFIGFIIFAVIVTVIVAVVHKKCRKQVG